MELNQENIFSTSGSVSFTETPLIQIYAAVETNSTKYTQVLKVVQFAAPSALSFLLFLVVIGFFLYIITQDSLLIQEARCNILCTTSPVSKDVHKNTQLLPIPSVSIQVPVEESPVVATLHDSQECIHHKGTLQLLGIIKKILGHLNRTIYSEKHVASNPANTAGLTLKRDVITKESIQEIIDATALSKIYSPPETIHFTQSQTSKINM